MFLETLMQAKGLTAASFTANSRFGKIIRASGVSGDTPEFKRIAALASRDWATEQVTDPTPILRTHTGKQTLRPIQQTALVELALYGGLFGSIRVGGGKTLISLLAPEVRDDVKKAALLLPAKLVDKTCREFRLLREHWRTDKEIRIISYEKLATAGAATWLDNYAPDMIIMDEAHRARNTKAVVARRLHRYALKRPDTRFVALSGTLTNRSIKDFSHILKWCLKEFAPIPVDFNTLAEWANAIDEKVADGVRIEPGALKAFAKPEDLQTLQDTALAKRCFFNRLYVTPGIVATHDAAIGVSLTLTKVTKPLPPSCATAQRELLDTWDSPCGEPYTDPLAVNRCARQLSLGFYYRWRVPPPREWAERRKAWGSFVRHTLRYNHRNLDSEFQVALAVSKGDLKCPDNEWKRWKEIEKTWTADHETVFLDETFVLEAVATFLETTAAQPTLIWSRHRAIAAHIEARMGISCFGARGQNKHGLSIEQHDPSKHAVLSIAANSEGRNLQAWSSNLVLCAPSTGTEWEQMLGRTHREGQQADDVFCSVLLPSALDLDALNRAKKDAEHIEKTLGQPQKLLYCDTL